MKGIQSWIYTIFAVVVIVTMAESDVIVPAQFNNWLRLISF